MPLNSDQLAQEMLLAIGGEITAQRQDVFKKIAEAIVNHIKINGLVTTVTSCPAGAGTGTGVVT